MSRVVGTIGTSPLNNLLTGKSAGKDVTWDDEGAVGTGGHYLWS